MAIDEKILQNNNIIRNLGHLLSQIDPRVRWTDYIPGTALKSGHSLVAIGKKDCSIRYVDISDYCDRKDIGILRDDLSPFKLVNRVLNAMDDYHLETQFLTQKQLNYIKDDIANLAKDRATIAKQTADLLRFSNIDCFPIIFKAQELGIFPQFFPKDFKEEEITGDMLADFIENCRATFIDTQIIADLVEERIKIQEMREDDYEMEYE